MTRAAAIARRLGAQRQGANWRCPCPLGCGYSLSICQGEDDRLLLHCFGGCEFHEILPSLVEFGLLDDDGDDPVHHGELHDDQHRRRHDGKRIAHARQIYDGGVWDERIHIYLRSRGINLTSTVLRFSETAPHRLGARLPALLAPIVNVSGDLTGVHLTFVRRDGAGKAALPKGLHRECRGVIRGGAIRLSEPDPDYELIVAEGIETTLSAMQLFGRIGWASISAAGIKTIELPPAIRRILIAADNDISGTGYANALAAYGRWRAEGRVVDIIMPPNAGTDFNDLLMAERGNDPQP